MKHTPLNKNNGKQKEQCSKTRTILSAIRCVLLSEQAEKRHKTEVSF
jgi:hypothetical protein